MQAPNIKDPEYTQNGVLLQKCILGEYSLIKCLLKMAQ